MASVDLHEKANFIRLSRLLVDKGTEALRNTFHGIHPAASLSAVLTSNKPSLLKLKPRVITDSQWDLLFPPSGNPPDSKTFDVTLLTALFRNICGLPKAGWGAMPVDTDRSMQANIARIKFYRNEVYAHVTSTRVDNATFEDLWKKISKALLELNVPQKDVEDLKICPLGPEEEKYAELLKEWKSKDEDCRKVLEELELSMIHLTKITKENHDMLKEISMSPRRAPENSNLKKDLLKRSEEEALLRKLAKHSFKGKIKRKVKFLHPGTRQWLFAKVDDWFNRNEDDSRIFLITAGPGFGKSVFAARVCEDFKKSGKLAACHFCDFSDSNLKNPMIMLQSLSSQMCENVPGFKEKLLHQLERPHELRNLKDAFRIYVQNPLDELELEEPTLVVVDGLDESSVDDKNEIVKLLEDYFPYLPDNLKVLVTSRPEISVAKLNSVSKINIANNDTENNSDLEIYLKACLPRLHEDSEMFKTLSDMCEGSFLYAFHAQTELNKRDDLDRMTFEEMIEFLPEGLDSVYRTYFERLEEELKATMPGHVDVLRILEILVSSKGPIPLTFVAQTFGLTSDGCETKKIIRKVNNAVSCLLYVSEDLITVFHKSVVDWLMGKGYRDHEYTVHVIGGERSLWKLSEQIFQEKVKKVVCSGSDLVLTNDVNYALRYGLEHLVASNIKESFFWLVDVVIMHVLLTKIFGLFVDISPLLDILKNVLRLKAFISNDLRARISWHIVEIELIDSKGWFINYHEHYLQRVLRHSPEDIFTDNERGVAKLLLSTIPRAIDFKSDHKTDFIPLAVWSDYSSRHVTAVGVSKDCRMAAIANDDGSIVLVCLPNLLELWSYSTGYENISCCSFAPDSSFVLFGKLEMALSISEKEELPFFHSIKETFTSCAFSRSGNRLVTSDGSCVIKLWDVARKSLLSSLNAEIPVHWCSFSYSELFIVGDKNPELCMKEDSPFGDENEDEDSFCVWNAITLKRCDFRMGSSEFCKSCCSSTFQIPAPHTSDDDRDLTRSTGIFKGVECTFAFQEQSLSVIENTHYTTIAAWSVAVGRVEFANHLYRKIVKMIEDDVWLYADTKRIIFFRILVSTERNSTCLPHPTEVYSSCFSPDGSKLATCTSDGCINIWDVYSGGVLSRFSYHSCGSPIGCWWSEKFIIVFDVIDTTPGLSNYSVDSSSNKLSPESQQAPLVFPFDELDVLKYVDMSQGLLILDCGKINPLLVFFVNGIGGPRMVNLPEIEPEMSIEVSPTASFVFGKGESIIYIWKRSEVDPTVYEPFFRERLSPTDKYMNKFVTCCFSKDSKVAMVNLGFKRLSLGFKAVLLGLNEHVLEIIDLDVGKVKSLECIGFYHKLLCLNECGVVIGITVNSLCILDMDSGAPMQHSFQQMNNVYLKKIKLSQNESTLAIPKINGDIQFVRLSFAERFFSSIRRRRVDEWNNLKKQIADLP